MFGRSREGPRCGSICLRYRVEYCIFRRRVGKRGLGRLALGRSLYHIVNGYCINGSPERESQSGRVTTLLGALRDGCPNGRIAHERTNGMRTSEWNARERISHPLRRILKDSVSRLWREADQGDAPRRVLALTIAVHYELLYLEP